MLAQILNENQTITFAEAIRISQDDCNTLETMEILEKALERWNNMTGTQQKHWIKERATIKDAKRVFGF